MNYNKTSVPQLEAHVDRKKLYLVLAVAICGYIVLAWFFLDRVERYILGAGVAIAVGYGLQEMFFNNTRIVIDERGVLDSRLGFGWIRWRDITRVYVTQYQNIEHVCLDVADPARYLSKRSITTRSLLKFHHKLNDVSPFNINVGVLDTSAGMIYQAVVDGIELYGEKDA